jgi:hypothetical protein
MTNEERVYIHELVNITGHNRARYLQHVTANWGPIGQAERAQKCFGVWAVVGSTGPWPAVVNLWEYASWAGLAENFRVELTGAGLQDSALAEWWAAAAELRSGGFDSILVAPDWSPSIDMHVSGVLAPAAGYVHEWVQVETGGADAFLDTVRARGIEARGEGGMRMVGAFRKAMCADDMVLLVWSFADWSVWGEFESGPGRFRERWSEGAGDIRVWDRMLLSDAPLSPLRIGRQPSVNDRKSFGNSYP